MCGRHDGARWTLAPNRPRAAPPRTCATTADTCGANSRSEAITSTWPPAKLVPHSASLLVSTSPVRFERTCLRGARGAAAQHHLVSRHALCARPCTCWHRSKRASPRCARAPDCVAPVCHVAASGDPVPLACGTQRGTTARVVHRQRAQQRAIKTTSTRLHQHVAHRAARRAIT